jgi:protoporphyrinogen oxidase
VSGHIIFSGYKYFNDFLAKVLGDQIRWIDRESWIKFEDRYVRYPFQNHLSSLPEQAMLECLVGLVESQTIDKDRGVPNFAEWVLAKFGAGVAKHFMNPYNFKVWSTPLEKMGYYWIAERVSVVDWRKAIETTLVPKTTDWGPNAKFGYPLHGGTLGLWKGVLPFLGDRVRYHKRAMSIDEEKREIEFADGTKRKYERLLSTMPIDALVSRLCHAPEKVRAAAKTLLFNRLFSVGIGLKRPSPSDKNWIYFPNPKTPFYRMTYLSNYSPEIVPGADTSKYFAVLTETSYSSSSPSRGRLRQGVIDGLVAEGILQPSDLPLIETVFLIHAGHAYPIPSTDRTKRSRRSTRTSSRRASSRAAASGPGSTRSATRTTR